MDTIFKFPCKLAKPLRLLTVITLLALFNLFGPAAAEASPVAYDGIVTIDTALTVPGGKAVISVNLSNNSVDLAALTIPLQFNNSISTIDSVSFVGSLLPPGIVGNYYVDIPAGIVKINYLPQIPPTNATISSPQGLLASIYFSINPLAVPGNYPVDSVNQEWININFADLSGETFLVPDFEAGALVVQIPTAVNDNSQSGLPAEFSLNQNYPNPFNPSTVIEFALPRASQVHLEVFNVLGQSVAELLNSRQPAGFHSVEFDASNYPSGIYFYRLSYDSGSETRKMILLK